MCEKLKETQRKSLSVALLSPACIQFLGLKYLLYAQCLQFIGRKDCMVMITSAAILAKSKAGRVFNHDGCYSTGNLQTQTNSIVHMNLNK